MQKLSTTCRALAASYVRPSQSQSIGECPNITSHYITKYSSIGIGMVPSIIDVWGYDILIQHSSFYHLNFAKSFHPSRRNQFQNFHGPVYKKWSLPNKMEIFLWPPPKFCTVHHVILFSLVSLHSDEAQSEDELST